MSKGTAEHSLFTNVIKGATCASSTTKTMKFAQFEDHILYFISTFTDAPCLVNLILSSKQFSAVFDADAVWRERKQREQYPKKLLRYTLMLRAKRLIPKSFSESKRAYVVWWLCCMNNRDIVAQNAFIDKYTVRLKEDLRSQTAQLITNSISRKLLAGTKDQTQCLHKRILFSLLKTVHENRKDLSTNLQLHVSCDHCRLSCLGAAWYCCACRVYMCTHCTDGMTSKPQHALHPLALHAGPTSGLEFNSTYSCGCFDCGVTVHVHARSRGVVGGSSGRADKVRQPLVEVSFVCAGVDGLFRQRCRSESGQFELLQRMRTENDFLLES
jgi:hypothetical protein